MAIRVCCISDLHGFLPLVEPCDLVLIAGDVCPLEDHSPAYQARWLAGRFSAWLKSLPAERVVWTAGNHDFAVESPPAGLVIPQGYLADAAVEFRGLTIWGSPWSVRFMDWAFMEDEEELARRYAMIPPNIDFLVSHTPPLGFGDRMGDGSSAGSSALRDRIREIAPRYVICGHIHEGRGSYRLGESEVLNVSYVNENYRPVNKPVYLDIEARAS